MALIKPIRQENGLIMKYHRILFIQSTINSHNSIAVMSYSDKDIRKSESKGQQPYRITVTYEKDYSENMTVEEAYAYLKTLPEFAGAQDI